jgi:hypothetical protein
MNLQEQINRIQEMMGVISEDSERVDIDWESMPTKQFIKRNSENEVIFLSPEKIYDRLATDNPDLDIRNNPQLRISDRLEKAKDYLRTYMKDPYIEPEYKDLFMVDGKWEYMVDPNYERQKMSFEPTKVYLDRYRLNDDGEPKVGISDGRHRLLAALELGMDKFPIEVYPEDKEYFISNFS